MGFLEKVLFEIDPGENLTFVGVIRFLGDETPWIKLWSFVRPRPFLHSRRGVVNVYQSAVPGICHGYLALGGSYGRKEF